jgi:hypothetical protein
MATPDTRTPPVPVTSAPSGLRLVLFGLPGAGKSSLLGALGEAGQTQEHLLHGRLNDISHGLATLRVRLYDEAPQPTVEEVVPCPVAFEPFDHAAPGPTSAVLLDCDGRVALELVQHPPALENGVPPGKLANELVNADALILAVDCSAPHEQLEEEFDEFDRFLRELELGRSARVDVGGLPVFLVLTKCDLLAQPGDTTVDWMERIEQRKREVGEHFRTFLARRADERGSLPFGQLELHLWATAVKRPALTGAPARPREPYGVAELFRQSLDRAAAYHRRCDQSRRRLLWTSWVAVGLAGAFVLLALFLSLRPAPRPPSELQLAVEGMQASEKPTPGERLRAPLTELRMRREKLRDWQKESDFGALPDPLRRFVVSRFNELDTYVEWVDDLDAVRRPVTVDTEEGLRDIKTALEKLGSRMHDDWNDTEGVRQYHERLDEVTVLLDGIQRVKAEYVGDPKKAMQLWSFDGYRTDSGINWRLWSADLEDLRRQFKPVKFKDPDELPGSSKLTYASVMRFDTVIDARDLRPRLERERNLAAALGLIDVPDRPPVLVIEKPSAFKLSLARERVQELQKVYPRYEKEFDPDFARADLPDAIRHEVARAALTYYDYLLEPARDLVLSRLQKAGDGDQETPARWNAVRDWLLTDPNELSEWRKLAVVLAHLHDPKAPDPVKALTAFLQETTFSLDITHITLELPDSLRNVPATNMALSIHHPRTETNGPAMVFEQDGDAKHDKDRRVMVYELDLKKGKRIVYLPGDDLWATLPLRNNMQLTWTLNRSTMYEFERLLRPPRLHKADEPNEKGERLEGVRVMVSPPEGWPRVPDLLPVVRLSR